MAVSRQQLFILRLGLALVGTVFLLNLYNRFILNANLQNLKTTLSALNTASGVGEAEAALLMVDQSILTQMASSEVDLKTLTTLQYAQGTLGADTLERPVKDAQVALDTLAEEEATKRSGVLAASDGVATGLVEIFKQVTFLPHRLFQGKRSSEIDTAQLEKAIRTERQGLFQEAIQMYQELLKNYPRYIGRTGLKLRAARLYERLQAFDEAKRLYRQVSWETDKPEEMTAAQLALENLGRSRAAMGQAQQLERSLSKTQKAEDRQRIAFRLGGAQIELRSWEKAARAFHEAALSNPEGELASVSKFKEGWCLKSAGRLEEAFKTFEMLVRQDPKSRWALAAYSQIAEIYKATGDFATAAKVYEEQLAKSKDDALTAAILLQAGSTYLFDLNSPRKAQVYFDMLTLNFPASPFSLKGQAILQTEAPQVASTPRRAPPTAPHPAPSTSATKPTEPFLPAQGVAISENAPVMTWLSEFLPIFVDVFVERLARYMQTTGAKELTRRYTEQEFQELVLRRVQERFPGKVRDISTKIQPDGFVGSGSLRLGSETFPIRARIGIGVVKERPHALIREVRVGNLTIPDPLLRTLEKRVNATIDQGDYPLKIKRYELKEGHALISVELEPK